MPQAMRWLRPIITPGHAGQRGADCVERPAADVREIPERRGLPGKVGVVRQQRLAGGRNASRR